MSIFFLDTSYHVAILDRRDQLHVTTAAIARRLDVTRDATFMTTDDVLVECLTYMSGQGERVRVGVVVYIDQLRRKRAVNIVRQSPALFDAGLALYSARPDKSYSMTDCVSMVVCRERGITDVLTYDRDFEQEASSQCCAMRDSFPQLPPPAEPLDGAGEAFVQIDLRAPAGGGGELGRRSIHCGYVAGALAQIFDLYVVLEDVGDLADDVDHLRAGLRADVEVLQA